MPEGRSDRHTEACPRHWLGQASVCEPWRQSAKSLLFLQCLPRSRRTPWQDEDHPVQPVRGMRGCCASVRAAGWRRGARRRLPWGGRAHPHQPPRLGFTPKARLRGPSRAPCVALRAPARRWRHGGGGVVPNGARQPGMAARAARGRPREGAPWAAAAPAGRLRPCGRPRVLAQRKAPCAAGTSARGGVLSARVVGSPTARRRGACVRGK